MRKFLLCHLLLIFPNQTIESQRMGLWGLSGQVADLGLLQQARGSRGGKAKAERAVLFAFDLLYLDGHDLTRMALSERRHMLEGLLPLQHGMIRLSEEVEAGGAAFLAEACRVGLEGIIAKRRDAPYRPGRGGDWLKIKCIQSDTFLIIGYEPSSAALGGIGSLLLAAHGNYGLAYVGSVGTGFTHASATALRKQLDRITAASPPARRHQQERRDLGPAKARGRDCLSWLDA